MFRYTLIALVVAQSFPIRIEVTTPKLPTIIIDDDMENHIHEGITA